MGEIELYEDYEENGNRDIFVARGVVVYTDTPVIVQENKDMIISSEVG